MTADFGFGLVATNLGASIETIFFLLIAVGGLIFYARDFRVGAIIHFVMFAALFMSLYALNESGNFGSYNYYPSLVAMLFMVGVLAITLYGQGKESVPVDYN